MIKNKLSPLLLYWTEAEPDRKFVGERIHLKQIEKMSQD